MITGGIPEHLMENSRTFLSPAKWGMGRAIASVLGGAGNLAIQKQ